MRERLIRFAGFLFCVALVLASLGGCSTVGMFTLHSANALAVLGDYHKTADVPYGPAPQQRLDIYVPGKPLKPAAPVVIFFYGGDWSEARPGKEVYRFVGDALTAHGYTVVIPDYRRYPSVTFPAFVEDGAAAVVWAHEHIAEYGGDGRRVILMGHSAGAHLAAMLALDTHYLTDAHGNPGWIAGVVGMAGPYCFLPMPDEPQLKAIFGPPSRYELSQPINYVRQDEPPMLLLAGGKDDRVPVTCTERMAARVRERGGRVETHTYQDLSHIMLIASLAAPVRWSGAVVDDIVDFMRRVTLLHKAGTVGAGPGPTVPAL